MTCLKSYPFHLQQDLNSTILIIGNRNRNNFNINKIHLTLRVDNKRKVEIISCCLTHLCINAISKIKPISIKNQPLNFYNHIN